MTLTDAVNFIITDPSVDANGIDTLWNAIRERQKITRTMEKAVAQATLRIGMEVEISGVRPKFWNGSRGVITGFNQTRTRANLKITASSHPLKIRVGQSTGGFPLTTLTALTTTPVVPDVDTTVMDFLSTGK